VLLVEEDVSKDAAKGIAAPFEGSADNGGDPRSGRPCSWRQIEDTAKEWPYIGRRVSRGKQTAGHGQGG
jgi:hypothetical protein